MNQKLITTDKATILLLMLPEGASNIGTELKYLPDRTRILYWDGKNKWNSSFHIDGNWQPLGFANEVSEEVAKEVVDNDKATGKMFTNYLNKNWVLFTALPALHSLLQANKVYLENLDGTEPENRLEWENTQQNTGNWYILKLEK